MSSFRFIVVTAVRDRLHLAPLPRLSSLVFSVAVLVGAIGCGESRRRPYAFTKEEQAAIRVALDSFPSVANEPAAAERTSRRGDTTVVQLISKRGMAAPGTWDGPRLLVWVLRPSTIVRSAMKIVD
jgi:hypothetical protein